MDVLLITLVVTLPIIAVGVIVWFWISRSATPATAERKKAALYSIFLVPAALYTLHGLLTFVQPYRYMLGISTVVLVNDSESRLNNVEMVMHAPNHHYTYRFDLRQRRRERFAVRTSELAVDRIAFFLKTQSFASTNVALAKRGQTLTLRVNPSGQIAHEID